MRNPCTSRGFTLVELMVVILLVAILSAFAVPSFKNVILKNRVSAATSELLAALNFARNEAITRGENISLTVQGGSDGSSWTIGTVGTPGTKIREHEKIQNVKINSGSGFTVTFTRLGAVSTSGTSGISDKSGISGFVVTGSSCPSNLEGSQRTININATGRVSNTIGKCS